MLYEFFHWWFSQLNSLVPSSLKRYWQQSACTLYVDVSRQALAVQANVRRKNFPLGEIDLSNQADSHKAKLAKFIQSLPRKPDRLVLRIAQKSYLQRDVELPLAAEECLQQAIEFQVEQLTPFPANQALNFSGIKQRLPADKKLLAWLVSIPQPLVQQPLTLLGYHDSTLVESPQKAPTDGQALELHYQANKQRNWLSLKSYTLLFLLLCLSLAGAFTLHLYNRVQSNDYLQNELNSVRIQAQQANNTQQMLDNLHTQTQQIVQHKAQHIPFIQVWNDITERLEDNTWLYLLDMRSRELRLQGISSEASALIEKLEASPYLQNVRFVSSVTRDHRSGKERFNISAQLLKPTDAPDKT